MRLEGRNKSEKEKDFLHESRLQQKIPWTSRWAERASAGVWAVRWVSARDPQLQLGGTALTSHSHPPHLPLTSLGLCHMLPHTEETAFPKSQEIN